MEVYEFKRVASIAVNRGELYSIINSCRLNRGVTRVDLGLRDALVEKHGDSCIISTESISVSLDLSIVEELLDDVSERDVVVITADGSIKLAEIRGLRYYRLVSLGETAPTLEINGIHMHRVSDTTPWMDSRLKAKLAGVKRGSRVLDICTGLGYTAIHSLLLGASSVTSIEVDDNVLSLAELNPWSEMLEDSRVILIHGDAFEVVRELEGGYHSIIHDPPRLTPSTGELYSIEFYRELYRLLKRGGRLFHYTGEPGRARGASFPSRIASRLKEVGFKVLGYNSRALGIIAVKP